MLYTELTMTSQNLADEAIIIEAAPQFIVNKYLLSLYK